MSAVQLRRDIKKAVDDIPAERLASLADYVEFLKQQPLIQRVRAAEKAVAAGHAVDWKKVRSDV